MSVLKIIKKHKLQPHQLSVGQKMLVGALAAFDGEEVLDEWLKPFIKKKKLTKDEVLKMTREKKITYLQDAGVL